VSRLGRATTFAWEGLELSDPLEHPAPEARAKLAQSFETEALRQYVSAKQRGYFDERYAQMLSDPGAVQTALDLIASGKRHPMFLRITADRRFELTIEWLVVQPQFQSLFDAGVVAAARSRLREVGYSG